MRDLRRTSTAHLLLAPGAVCSLFLGLLGAIESFYVAPLRFTATWYALGLYGLIGMLVGLLWGLVFGGQAKRRDFGLLWIAGRAAAIPVFLLTLTAAGFLVFRDLWQESVDNAGILGWLVMVSVPVGATIMALVARKVSSLLVNSTYKIAIGMLLVSLSGLIFASWIEGTGVSVPEHKASAQPDNRTPVIFVVVDAMRADVLGSYGSTRNKTPHLDAFARESVRFAEAWSASTWTRPAVSSIMTGQFASVHQTMHKSDRLPTSLPTIAGMLANVGYTTLASVTNVNLAPMFGLGRGFDAWAYLAPEPHLAAPVSASRLFLVELYRLVRLRFFPGQRRVESHYAKGERVTQVAKDLLEPVIDAKRPFFAYLHFMETHDPYFAHPYNGKAIARVENPRPPVEMADEMLNLYYQEVNHFDTLFGQLVAWLKEKGIYQRSLIVVTADHGEEFADHGYFWHGTSLYRELVRVPLLIRFPNAKNRGSVRNDLVSLVDLFPTALSQAGCDVPKKMPGIDLAKPPPATARNLFAQLDHQGCILAATRHKEWKLIRANADNFRNLPELQLFDISMDPKEQKDLKAREKTRVEKMKILLDKPDQSSQAPVAKPEQVDVDSQTEEQLRSLGYTE